MTPLSGTIPRGPLAAILTAAACLVGPVAGAAAQETLDTDILSRPPALSNHAFPVFTFTGTQGASFECRLQPVESTFRECSSPQRFGEAEYGIPVPDGDYVFEVRAVQEPTQTPRRPGGRSPSTQPRPRPPSPADRATPPRRPPLSCSPRPARTGFSCRLDGGSLAALRSPQAYSALSLGAHRFEVTAVDAAGKPIPLPPSHAWQVLKPGLVIPAGLWQAGDRPRQGARADAKGARQDPPSHAGPPADGRCSGPTTP